ncbi:MAG: WD40 repeat domain-containing protein [Pirellulaceae bacterium]
MRLPNFVLALALFLLAGSCLAQAPVPPQLQFLEGHKGAVRDVAYTADNKLLLSVGLDGSLRVWDRTTGQLVRTIAAHSRPNLCLTLTPDGLQAITGGVDGSLKFFDVPRPSALFEIAGIPAAPTAIAPSADGKFVLTGDAGNYVRLFDATTKAHVRDYPGSAGGVTGVAAFPEQKLILATAADGALRGWNFDTAAPTGLIQFPSATALAVHQQGKLLAVTGADGVLRLASWPPTIPQSLAGHTDQVTAVVMSADGSILGSGGIDSQVLLFKKDGSPLRPLPAGPGKIGSLALSADSKLAAAGSDTGAIKFWLTGDGADKGMLAGHVGAVSSLSFHPTDPRLASTGADGTVRIWRLPSVSAPWPGHTQPVTVLAMSKDGKTAVTAAADKSVRIWNTATGKPVRVLENLPQPIMTAAVSPSGKQVALGDVAGEVTVQNSADGKGAFTLVAHVGGVTGLAWLDDEKILATCGNDGLLKYWRLPPVQPIKLANQEAVKAVVLSPDGKTIAATNSDGSVRLVTLATGKEAKKLAAFSTAVTTLTASSDRAILAAGSASGQVHLWNFADGTPRGTVGGHTGPVQAIALHPKLPQLATGGDDGTIRLWNLPQPAAEIAHHKASVRVVAVSPDAKTALTGDTTGIAQLWSLPDLKAAAALTGGKAPLFAAAFRRDNQQAALGDADGMVRLYGTVDGESAGLLGAHEGAVTGVSFHPNNAQMATSGADGTLRLWQLPIVSPQPLAKHTAAINAVAVTSDGLLSLSGGSDKFVHVLDHATGKPRSSVELPAPITALAAAPDNSTGVAATQSGTLHFFALADGAVTAQIGAHPGPVSGVAYKPQGGQLATTGADGKVRLWEIPAPQKLLSDHTAKITAVALSPNGLLLATAAADKSVRIWNVADGAASWTLGHADSVTALAWKSDSTQLVTASADKTIRVWNIADGKQAVLLEKASAITNGVAFAPDGASIYAAGTDKVIRQWKLADGLEVRSFGSHDKPIAALLLANAGNTLVTASEDGAIRTWNTSDGSRVLNISHGAAPTCLAVSADGKFLAAGSADKSVKLYNVADGSLSQTIAGHGGAVTAINFSPDNLTLATAAADGQVRIWNLQGVLQEYIPSADNVPTAVTFLPDSRGLAVGGEANLVRIVRRALVRVMDVSPMPLANVAYSADGNFILTGGADKTVRLWSAADGSQARNFAGQSDAITCVAISKDGTKVFAASADKTVRVWNYSDAALLATLLHPAVVRTLGSSPDGLKIASGGDDHLLRIWDLTTQKIAERFVDFAKPISALAMLPDGKALVAGGAEGFTRKLSVSNLAIVVAHNGAAGGVIYNSDGQKLITSGADKLAKQWDPALKPLAAPPPLPPSDAALSCVALRGDNLQIASGGEDKNVYLWRADTGLVERKIPTPAAIVAVAYSADNTRLAVAGADNQIRIFNPVDGMLLETLSQKGPLTSVAFAGTSAALLTGGTDNLARLHSLALLKVVPGHVGPVTGLAYSPDGAALISGGADKTVRHWNSVDGATVKAYVGVTDVVTGVAVSPDGTRVIASSADKVIRLWNFADAAALPPITLAAPLRSLTLSPDGTRLAASGDDGPVHVLELPSGKELETLPTHGGAATSLSFAADNRSLASTGPDKIVRIDLLAAERVIVADPMKIHSLAATPDGKQVVTSGEDKLLKLWDLKGVMVKQFVGSPLPLRNIAVRGDGLQIAGAGDPTLAQPNLFAWNVPDAVLTVNVPTGAGVTAMSYLDDGRIAVAGADKHLRVFAAKDGKPLEDSLLAVVVNRLESADGKSLLAAGADNQVYRAVPALEQLLTGHEGAVSAVVWTSDGTGLITAGADKTVRQWNLKDAKPERTFSGSAAAVLGLALSPDGKRLMAACADNAARVWDFAAKPADGTTDVAPLLTLIHPAAVRSIAASQDGSRIVTAADDGLIRLWDGVSGKELERLPGHAGLVHSVRLSSDGKTVLSGGADKTVRRWTASVTGAVQAHEGPIADVAISTDGQHLFSAGADKVASQWSVADLKQIRKFDGATAPLKAIAVSGDGKTVAAGGDDLQLRLWSTADGKPLAALALPAAITSLKLGKDSSKILVGTVDGVLRNYALATVDGKSQLVLNHEARGHAAGALRLATTASDDRSVFSAGADLKVMRWHGADYAARRSLASGKRPLYDLAVSADGKRLATASGDGIARVFDLEKGELLFELKGHARAVQAVAFRPDGKELATAGADGVIRLWDPEGKEVTSITANLSGPLSALAWAADNRTLQVGGTKKLWQTFDRMTQQQTRAVEGHNHPLRAIRFNATLTRVATLDDSGKLFVRDAAGGGALFHQQLPVAAGYRLAWSADGSEIAVAGSDPRILRVTVPAGAR